MYTLVSMWEEEEKQSFGVGSDLLDNFLVLVLELGWKGRERKGRESKAWCVDGGEKRLVSYWLG